jgi:hypothetical protein
MKILVAVSKDASTQGASDDEPCGAIVWAGCLPAVFGARLTLVRWDNMAEKLSVP